jgi:hypothetical protein
LTTDGKDQSKFDKFQSYYGKEEKLMVLQLIRNKKLEALRRI